MAKKEKKIDLMGLKRVRKEAELNMSLMSSSVHQKTDVNGFEIFRDKLPPNKAIKEINKFMKRFNVESFNWSVWLANFWENGDERSIQPKVIHVKSKTTQEIDYYVREQVLMDADESIENKEFTREDWRGFGYVITLNETIDFEAEEERFIDMLEEKGIWDQTLRHLVTEQKRNRRSNSKELEEAMEQLEKLENKVK